MTLRVLKLLINQRNVNMVCGKVEIEEKIESKSEVDRSYRRKSVTSEIVDSWC